MSNIKEFYKNTKNAKPHDNVKDFINTYKGVAKKAIDLGCGEGRDTIFLLKNNWYVTAIDRENTKSDIEEKLTEDEKIRFNFKCQNFENIKLEKADLIVANFSIPFCNKEMFKKLWAEIVGNINKNRIFCWKFLWKKRFLGLFRK